MKEIEVKAEEVKTPKHKKIKRTVGIGFIHGSKARKEYKKGDPIYLTNKEQEKALSKYLL